MLGEILSEVDLTSGKINSVPLDLIRYLHQGILVRGPHTSHWKASGLWLSDLAILKAAEDWGGCEAYKFFIGDRFAYFDVFLP